MEEKRVNYGRKAGELWNDLGWMFLMWSNNLTLPYFLVN